MGDVASLDRVVHGEDVLRFAELTGDDNPLHVDDGYAARIGMGRRVAHGMLTASLVSTVIGTKLPGPGALWISERFSFRAPVHVDDLLRVEVRIRHISQATRVLGLDVSVTNQHGTVVLDGDAQVQVLEGMGSMGQTAGVARSAVVTGSGRGIGAAIARRLAADGLNVVLNFRVDEASAIETERRIRADGGEATSFGADVSNPDEARALVEHAIDRYGPLDVLVNNAGGPTDPRSLADTTWEHMERQLASHLRGSFHCTEVALPGMLDRGFGRIVNITSEAAFGTPPNKMTGYVVAKAALAAFTRCVAQEAGPRGVTANAVAPGMVATELVADIPQRTKLTTAAQAPLRRLATAEDVADAVAFLVGPQAGYVTGQTLHLDGGQVMP